MEAIDVSAETVAILYRAVKDIRDLSEVSLRAAEHRPFDVFPEFVCPECGNRFSFVDGTRTLTHSERHYCPLPDSIRRLRNRRDIEGTAGKMDNK